MNPQDVKLVYDAIAIYGNMFWNDRLKGFRVPADRYPDGWNGFLFNDVLECLNRMGYDFVVVPFKDEDEVFRELKPRSHLKLVVSRRE